MTSVRTELMPGVWLTTVSTTKFKSSYWSVQLLTPLREETAALNAVLPQVLRRGTSRLPDQASLSKALDELYGGVIEPTVRKCGDVQCIGFEASFLDDACAPAGARLLEQAASLLGDMLVHPATRNGRLRQDYVLSEKDNLLQAMDALRSDKRVYARERLVEQMCAGDVYALSRLGTREQAGRINVARLNARYQTLLQEAPIELFYCGSAPARRVELAWREALMSLPRNPNRLLPDTDAGRQAPLEPKRFVETMDVVQGKLELGFRVGFGLSDPMFPAVMVANAMFGGSTMSRLFLHVREEKSLCYYASSVLLPVKGLALVSCGVDPEQFDAARDAILEQLEELKAGNFNEAELEAAKRWVVNALRAQLDDQPSLCSAWLRDCAAGERFAPEHLMRQVEEVTEGMAAAAAMQLNLDTEFRLSGRPEGGENDESA